ncbi:MAG: helix-turn-helix domain-containing protein, partial [Aeromicrobium sp.]
LLRLPKTEGHEMQRITPFEASARARRQRLGDVGLKIILMLLADYSDEQGSCFPGVKRIAEETEQSRSTVLRKMRLLAEVGLVSVARRNDENGQRTSNRYTLDLSVTATKADVELAKERIEARHEEPGTVQGVNVTLGSDEAPKSHAERGPKVSPGDTLTTRGTTSSTPYPHGTSADEQEQGTSGLKAVSASSEPSAGPSAPQIGFEDFWAAYPRKTSKGSAKIAWTRAMRKVNHHGGIIMDGLEQAQTRWTLDRTETRFVPHASTWLNGERWMDDYGLDAQQPENPWAGVPHASTLGQAQ